MFLLKVTLSPIAKGKSKKSKSSEWKKKEKEYVDIQKLNKELKELKPSTTYQFFKDIYRGVRSFF